MYNKGGRGHHTDQISYPRAAAGLAAAFRILGLHDKKRDICLIKQISLPFL